MSDSHSNSFHLTYNSLNDAVDEAMKYLEPSSHQLLTVESVARAYTILQQAQAAVECHNHGEQISARFHQIKSILNKTSRENKNNDWMQQHADLYRALLLSSFLWLELAAGDDDESWDSPSCMTILQSSAEKCLLLLQALRTTANHGALPTSRHALLQAVLDEPLVPLDKQERQYSYILQARTIKRDTATNDVKEEEELRNDEEFVVATMDRKELLWEEKELLKLASKPVPALTTRNIGAPCGGGSIMDGNDGPVHEERQNGLVHCGLITYWIHNDSSPRIVCNFSVYDCGLLTVTSTSIGNGGTMRNDDHPPRMQAWLLSPSSTCVTKTDDEEQSVHLIVTQCYQVHTTMPFHVNHGNACSLEYKVNTLSEVDKWVTSIHNVIQSLQDAVKLQQELQQEWKEEYQVVLMGYNTNVPTEE
jgi:hypothetical protein